MYILVEWSYGAEDYEATPQVVSNSIDLLKKYHAEKIGGLLLDRSKQWVNLPNDFYGGTYHVINKIEELVAPPIDWSWDCPTSPTGKCEYADDDFMEDSCIHCGQPEERK